MDETAVLTKRVAEFILLPPGGPILLGILGLLLIRGWPRFGRTLAWIGLLTALLCCTRLVGYLIAMQVEGPTMHGLRSSELQSELAGKTPPQAIVILGGGTEFDLREADDPNRLSATSLQRVLYGVRLARASKLPILVSGGPARGPGRRPEAELMAEVIRRDLGEPVKWVEPHSLDTMENASLSAQTLHAAGVHKVLLVTHSLHIRRARHAFEAAGLDVVPAPAIFSGGEGALLDWAWLPSNEGMALTWMASHEWVGLLWYRLRQTLYNTSDDATRALKS
jgi:uncharacterized SAM-binding protein YcdF (DUF218 family)